MPRQAIAGSRPAAGRSPLASGRRSNSGSARPSPAPPARRPPWQAAHGRRPRRSNNGGGAPRRSAGTSCRRPTAAGRRSPPGRARSPRRKSAPKSTSCQNGLMFTLGREDRDEGCPEHRADRRVHAPMMNHHEDVHGYLPVELARRDDAPGRRRYQPCRAGDGGGRAEQFRPYRSDVRAPEAAANGSTSRIASSTG